jgi:hypothetical protein
MDWAFVVPFISGGLAGTLISIIYSQLRNKREYSSLILSFCFEFVLLFDRCVMYYEQAVGDQISYSTLFTFTDSSAFSKLASVTNNPEVATVIIELKAKYFQIKRHTDEAANYALEGSRTRNLEDKKIFMEKAHHAQGTALAFFLGSYDELERKTNLLVQAAKQSSPDNVWWDISEKLSDAKRKYSEAKKKQKFWLVEQH